MADDQYKPVIDAEIALNSVSAAVEIRRGYLKLVESCLAPFPVAFQYDQKKRNQMITLLSRADTLWVLLLIHAESSFAPANLAKQASDKRKAMLGNHLTRAAIAKGVAIYEADDLAAVTQRRHTVAAGRIVEAALSYQLVDLGDKPNQKQQPVTGTKRLAEFLHALGDHVYWVTKDLVEPHYGTQSDDIVPGFKEAAAAFEQEDFSRVSPARRITSQDAALALLRSVT